MSCPDILACGQYVGDVDWNQSAEGDLEGLGFQEPAGLIRAAIVNVKPVVADATGIRKVSGSWTRLVNIAAAVFPDHFLLKNRFEGLNSAGFSDVCGLGDSLF